MKRATSWIAFLWILVAGPASAQDTPSSLPASAKPPEGILPIPDYSGDLGARRFLTGDWGGARTDLANKGIQFDLSWNQYLQGVVDGGRHTEARYGGKGDYLVHLDLQRMGALSGALLKFRAESRYGDSVNGAAATLMPVNSDAFFPIAEKPDDDIPFTITNLLWSQNLSEEFGIFLGKFDTLDGDGNEFASGRGTTQFMNANFLYNATLALRFPYSTLGGGFAWKPSSGTTISSTLMNTVDSSTTTGFDDIGEGTTSTTEVSFQHGMGGLPGGETLGFLYSFDQDFTKLGSKLAFQPGQGLSFQSERETWAFYWSAWQYVTVEDPTAAPVNRTNGEPDHQGLGFFARAGFADQDTNPIDWSLSGGVGGRGIFPSRDDDTYGVGYFFNDVQTHRLTGIAGVEDQTQGFEAFYNFAVTPAARLTLDAQVIEPVSSGLDTAWVLGLRLGIRF